MKVEIKNYRAVNKGAFTAFFTLTIEGIQANINGQCYTLQLDLNDCKYFSKGEARWFKYADKEYKNNQGEAVYSPIVKFNLPFEPVLEALKLQEGNAQVPSNSRQADSVQAESPFDFPRTPF